MSGHTMDRRNNSWIKSSVWPGLTTEINLRIFVKHTNTGMSPFSFLIDETLTDAQICAARKSATNKVEIIENLYGFIEISM